MVGFQISAASPLTALENPCSLGDCIGYMTLYLLDSGGLDERTHRTVRKHSIPDLQLTDSRLQTCRQLIDDGFVDVDAVNGDTGLAHVAELRSHGLGNHYIKICILEDDRWRLPAELQRDLLDVIGSATHE